MNRAAETKNRKNFWRCLIVLIFAGNFIFPLRLLADSALDVLNSQQTANQQKLQQINKQINAYQQQIASAQNKANTLKNEVFIYDSQIASTQLAIAAKQTQIEDTQTQINALQKLIEQKQQGIVADKEVLSQLIIQLNEYDSEYNLKTTLGSNNLSEFLDQIQYTQSLNDKIYQVEQKIKELKAQLQSQQHDLQIQLTNLQALQKQLQITQDSLTTQRNQKQALLNQTKGVEKNYQKLLANSKQSEADLEKEISDLDAQIRAKLGKRTITATKGILAWPMDGILTQGYGNTGFTSLGYTFHNGIDIAGPPSQAIYAAADGVVLDTNQSDDEFGNWVAVKHTIATAGGSRDIVALYAHFKTFIVSAGQQVSQGDLLGYEGNTGNTTKKLYGPERGYHLHFGIYDFEGFGVATGKYQNIYGPYRVPYGYTYNPLDFLPAN